MKRWGFLLVLSALLWPHTVAAQAVPLANYWQQIEDLQALVITLADEPVAVQQAQLASAASQFALTTVISLPDGRQLTIDHTYLLNELSREPPDLDRLYNLLTAWQEAHAEWPEAQFDTLDEATLQTILSQPQFRYETAEPSRWQRWLSDLRLRLWQWLSSLFPNLNAIGGPARLINYLVTFLGIVAVIVVLLYIWRTFLGDFAAEAGMVGDDVLGDEVLTADAALQRAQQFSGEGDYRTAVRYLYLSALLLLEERGLLRYNRSLTNREYLRSLASQPELAAVLRDVIEVFDRVWYGFHALEPTEYDWYVERVDLLKRQRGRRD